MKGIFESNDLSIVVKQVEGFRGFVPMFHAHMEIVCVLRGSIRMNIDGIGHTLIPGEMSLCFPYVIHSYEASPDASAIILLFSAAAAGVFSRRLLRVRPITPFVPASEETLLLLRQILGHNSQTGELHAITAQAYLSALAGHLLTSVPMEQVDLVDTNTVQDLLGYCASHYREDLNITRVASALHVSPNYVSRLFAEKLECPFRTYINRLRILDAKKLLKTSGRTVIDIMLECGFRNQSSFNRIFAQEVGCTPREYRGQTDDQ